MNTTADKEKPNVVGVNVLQQNGINVEELIKMLVNNASVEFTAYYYFANLRAHCTGPDGESIKGVIEDARMEDLSHFESCLSRIYELGEACHLMHKSLLECLPLNFFNYHLIEPILKKY